LRHPAIANFKDSHRNDSPWVIVEHMSDEAPFAHLPAKHLGKFLYRKPYFRDRVFMIDLSIFSFFTINEMIIKFLRNDSQSIVSATRLRAVLVLVPGIFGLCLMIWLISLIWLIPRRRKDSRFNQTLLTNESGTDIQILAKKGSLAKKTFYWVGVIAVIALVLNLTENLAKPDPLQQLMTAFHEIVTQGKQVNQDEIPVLNLNQGLSNGSITTTDGLSQVLKLGSIVGNDLSGLDSACARVPSSLAGTSPKDTFINNGVDALNTLCTTVVGEYYELVALIQEQLSAAPNQAKMDEHIATMKQYDAQQIAALKLWFGGGVSFFSKQQNDEIQAMLKAAG
jgi:hypothetical protein